MEKPGDPRNRRSQRNRTEQTVQTLIAALLLGTTSGCATYDFDQAPAPSFNARPASRPVTVVYVQRGDTIPGIARRYGLSPQAVVDANGLSAPYRLTRGERLVLPPSSVHIVEPGDTVSSIARAYGVPRDSIIASNDLATPDNLRPGERIAVPFAAPVQRPAARNAQAIKTVELAAPAKVETTNNFPTKSGPDPRLAGGRYYALGTPRAKPEFEGQGGPEEFAPPDEPEVDADAAYSPKKAATKVSDRETLGRTPGKFIWPVRGKVLSGFGRRGTGVHNDGINIAAEPGSPVKAADGGVVVYAGNELAGYGNLLLLRHPSGYVTAYAHNKKLLVERGDAVKQGQTVATVGSTGDVDRPQLHFEIRKGDRAVDPNLYLVRSTASR
ncbi:MAG: LysM peptidoglycan-binding domain-containing M23 family metallopeptidase [Alphaproteobacteria bacterium]|nr:LysM peptidoglycan-binding domain-containing M23 family metallopeptidase [Alphaproteobacteria bacterium]